MSLPARPLTPAPAEAAAPDLALIRAALASSTLAHGLRHLGDRWTMQILMAAFLGVKGFDAFHEQLGIPRATLSERLKALVALGLFEKEAGRARARYRLAPKGRALYDAVLMIWDWERRFGEGGVALPERLVHRRCGHAFRPVLACGACGEEVTLADLEMRLLPNLKLKAVPAGRALAPRVSLAPAPSLGLRLDRWALLIVSAVILGCRHFDALEAVLEIGPSVLTGRLKAMVAEGLLKVAPDPCDGRRKIYRLTPAARALFPYLATFTTWASEHLFETPTSIAPLHRSCGQPFVARAICSACHERLLPHDVRFTMGPAR